MSLVIEISKNKKIILPPDYKNQDEFIGLWLKAQSKAITKVTDEFIFKTYSQEEFDDKVDEVTYTIYKQLRNGETMFIDENSKPKEKLKAWYLFTEDFIAGTSHLTNEEIGIYIRLLCWNWNKRCVGLPKNINTIKRIASCFTESEKLSCENIVKQFFVEMDDHYQNERQLQEYLYIRKRIDASKVNGKLGGRPKNLAKTPPLPLPLPLPIHLLINTLLLLINFGIRS